MNRNNEILRIPLLDKLKDGGLNIFGKVESGTIKDNMTVILMPHRQEIKIDSIYDAMDH